MRNKELFRGRRKAGRIVGLVLTLALAVSLLSGCGQSKERLTFGTGGTAGTYYSYGGVLAQYITNNTNVKVTAVSTGGSKANLQSVQDGDFQLGFVQSDVMAYAWDGVRAFEQDGATHDFRTLGGLYAETVQLFTMDSDIKTVEDLKGKSVSIGAANSGVYFNALDVLNAGGITLDDIHPQYLSFEDSKESLKDGKIDAAFIVAGAPTTAITELATTNGVYMINIDGAIRDSILSDCPYYTWSDVRLTVTYFSTGSGKKQDFFQYFLRKILLLTFCPVFSFTFDISALILPKDVCAAKLKSYAPMPMPSSCTTKRYRAL